MCQRTELRLFKSHRRWAQAVGLVLALVVVPAVELAAEREVAPVAGREGVPEAEQASRRR